MVESSNIANVVTKSMKANQIQVGILTILLKKCYNHDSTNLKYHSYPLTTHGLKYEYNKDLIMIPRRRTPLYFAPVYNY